MQHAGTLKKRKKRNLAKVGGLTVIPQQDFEDSFGGLFTPQPGQNDPRFISYQTGNETRLRMSSLMGKYDSRTNSGRVTRNPSFHAGDLEQGNLFPNRDYAGSSPPFINDPDLDLKPRSDYIKERPHLLDKATMNRLRMLLLLGTCSGAFPWYWCKKEYRIEKWSPTFEKLWKVQWFFVTAQTIFLTGFQFYSFYSRLSGQNKTYREVFMNSLSVFWYVCAVYFNINMYIYKDRIREYINTMLRFNKEYVDKYLLHTEGYVEGGRVLISVSIPSNCSQVFASVALFLVMPFQPWYLFSYIYPKPWYWLIPGAIQEFIVVGQVITSYMVTAWIVVAHANSVEFWLREAHKGNDGGYTRNELRRTQTALETYRSLQVLCTCFNDCMSSLAVPLVKIHVLTGLIPCGYVLIRSMNHIFIDEFPGILTYPIGLIDGITALFAMLTMAAGMFDLAGSFMDSWGKTKDKKIRRVLMSCPALKVKVAGFYFITVSTTITYFKALFDFITDCIITFP